MSDPNCDPITSVMGSAPIPMTPFEIRKISIDINHPFHELRETGSFSSVVNLTNSIIGAGILGLPYAFAAAGWSLGYLLIAGSALLAGFSVHILSLCAAKVEYPSSFYAVTNASIPSCTFLVDISVVVMCFGVAISYLIVIGGLMPDAMSGLGVRGFLVSRLAWILAGFAIVAPLSCFKHLDALKFTSTLAVFFVMFIAAMILVYAADGSLDKCEDEDDDCTGTTSTITFNLGTIKVLGVFIYAYSCQMNIFPVVNELREPNQGRVNNIIYCTIAIAFTLYALVAGAGYATYGDAVESNVLVSYPKTMVTSFARIFISLLVAFSYPLLSNPGRSSAMELWRMTDQDPDGAEKNARFRFIVITMIFLFGSLGVALVLEDLGVVLALIGATGSTVITFILPGAAYYIMFKNDDTQPVWKLHLAHFLSLFGLVFMPVCLVSVFL